MRWKWRRANMGSISCNRVTLLQPFPLVEPLPIEISVLPLPSCFRSRVTSTQWPPWPFVGRLAQVRRSDDSRNYVSIGIHIAAAAPGSCELWFCGLRHVRGRPLASVLTLATSVGVALLSPLANSEPVLLVLLLLTTWLWDEASSVASSTG